ncbi:MAG TPA: arylamine N-acetyltransferase [Sphingomonas sp.]|jgi:N-hydroxyarylamine O-acetyltransferase|uniref:arylamine N-acetyltransferase family protein n=1 Tax=Sphingomonas sp. TaxID=28214 RepID=UPI002EDAE648
MTLPFDLATYLARIGVPDVPAADADGLALVQRAHRMAIPFENLDVLLGRGISLDPDAVFDKLVLRRRGGYCFEHNQLFGRALDALGFVVRPLLARVWLGVADLTDPAAVPSRTHCLSLVELPDGAWIADAGFGGAYTPPMPLVDGAQAKTPDGAVHHLVRDAGHGWILTRDGDLHATDARGVPQPGGGAIRQYSFTAAPVWPADLEQCNHHIATVPNHRFTTIAIASIVLPSGFASLTDRHYRRRNGTEAIGTDLTDPRVYRMRLSLVFGIDLEKTEVAALGLF